MKYAILILMLLSGCETFTAKYGPKDLDSTRVICSEAGGLWGLVSGKTQSCTVVGKTNAQIKKAVCDQDGCSIELESGE